MINLNANEIYAYIGSYAKPETKGIHFIAFSMDTGALRLIDGIGGIENPSFLTLNSQQNCLYAVSESSDLEGSVICYHIDASNGALKYLNEQPSFGMSPCHVELDSLDSHMMIANYSSGTMASYPIGHNGEIGPSSQVINHNTGLEIKRSSDSHPHSINYSRLNRFVIVPDLGLDSIFIYKRDDQEAEYTLHKEVQLTKGSGPRHFTIHPNRRFAYVINELDSTITAFHYNEHAGDLSAIQTISTLPKAFKAWNACADIHLSSDGLFIYASNRGHNSIAVFAVQTETGLLEVRGYQSTKGAIPRNFAIDPTGKYMLVANQETNQIVCFGLNKETGALVDMNQQIEIASPVCIKWYKP
jgi:6-phosphogluconolactonase